MKIKKQDTKTLISRLANAPMRGQENAAWYANALTVVKERLQVGGGTSKTSLRRAIAKEGFKPRTAAGLADSLFTKLCA